MASELINFIRKYYSPEEKIQSADFSQKAKEMFKKAKQYHDEKWLSFKIQTENDLEDINSLLLLKKTPLL